MKFVVAAHVMPFHTETEFCVELQRDHSFCKLTDDRNTRHATEYKKVEFQGFRNFSSVNFPIGGQFNLKKLTFEIFVTFCIQFNRSRIFGYDLILFAHIRIADALWRSKNCKQNLSEMVNGFETRDLV